jgi:hypothetical protein
MGLWQQSSGWSHMTTVRSSSPAEILKSDRIGNESSWQRTFSLSVHSDSVLKICYVKSMCIVFWCRKRSLIQRFLSDCLVPLQYLRERRVPVKQKSDCDQKRFCNESIWLNPDRGVNGFDPHQKAVMMWK